MQQKYYGVIGTVIALAIIGIIFTSTSYFKNIETIEPQMALCPYVVFEGTVISLSLDKSMNYSQGDEIISLPNDSAVVKIDRVIETGGSNFNWTSLGIKEGEEASLDFKYTVRPAKIITVVGKTIQSGGTVSHTVSPTKITFEDGYFAFRVDGSSNTETILPGLKEGSKFKAKLWRTFEVKIEKYEIIS